MSTSFSIEPIGVVRSTRTEPVDDDWDRERATIELVAPYTAESLLGLEQFSHVDVVYIFDRVDAKDVVLGARHPRGNTEWPKVGIFAQRGRVRPNRIGVTTCRLVSVAGTSVAVEGLDAIDGTPVVDIKPVMTEFMARGPVFQPPWSREIMREYWRKEPRA